MSDDNETTSEEVTTRKTDVQYRTLGVERTDLLDEDSRRIRIGVTSEAPVARSFGMEVLDHRAETIDMEFMASGRAPLLLGHDTQIPQIGVVESFELDPVNKRTVATVRFGESKVAEEVWRDVVSGVIQNTSCGYQIDRMERDDSDPANPVMRCGWTPLEVSVVSIPADTGSQIGLARSEPETTIAIRNDKEVEPMAETENTPTPEPTPEVDLEAVRADERARTVRVAREEAQATTSEIIALGERFGKRDLALEHIQAGSSPIEFRTALLNQLEPSQQPVPPNPDITPKEQRSYSLMRAVRAASTNDWREAGYEREVSDEIAHITKKEARGFYVPTNMQWRDQTVSPTSAGGFLVGTDHMADEFVEALYALAIVPMLGARRLEGLQGDIAIPRLSTSATNVSFVAEGSSPTESAETFSQISMSPKTLAGYIDLSRKLVQQSNPSIEAVVRDEMLRTFASAIDSVCINGGGSNEPTGVIGSGDTPVSSIGTNGGAITWAKIQELIKTVEDANAVGTSPAFLTNPSVASQLRQLPKQASGVEGNFLLDPDGRLSGYFVGYTTNVPSNLTKGSSSGVCSALIFGDFSQFFLAFLSGLDVVVDSSSLSTSGGTRLAFFQDVDCAVRNPGGFCVTKDITT